MEMIRTSLLHIVVGLTVGCLLIVATPLKAGKLLQGDGETVRDAFSKLHSTPAHVYTTSKIGSQSFTSEIIYAAGNIYMKLNGKWTLSDSIKSVGRPEQQIRHNANSKDTCRYVKDEPIKR